MTAADSLAVRFELRDGLPAESADWWRGVLGIAQFSASASPVETRGIPLACVAAPPLGQGASLFEVWRAAEPLRSGRHGPVRFRLNDGLLFGTVEIAERRVGDGASDGTALQAATEDAYAAIFETLEQCGYPFLWRTWNYLADINRDGGELERYRQFNSARQRAFRRAGRRVEGTVPAACALGLRSGQPLVVYFLAGVDPAEPVENPRQVAAYAYPVDYGPASPTFSRATRVLGPDGAILLISGTSSIVGHRSVHADDVIAQTRESMANIRALLANAHCRESGRRFTVADCSFKVYLRDGQDQPAVADELRGLLGATAAIAYVQADICRRELLVEVEAVGHSR